MARYYEFRRKETLDQNWSEGWKRQRINNSF